MGLVEIKHLIPRWLLEEELGTPERPFPLYYQGQPDEARSRRGRFEAEDYFDFREVVNYILGSALLDAMCHTRDGRRGNYDEEIEMFVKTE